LSRVPWRQESPKTSIIIYPVCDESPPFSSSARGRTRAVSRRVGVSAAADHNRVMILRLGRSSYALAKGRMPWPRQFECFFSISLSVSIAAVVNTFSDVFTDPLERPHSLVEHELRFVQSHLTSETANKLLNFIYIPKQNSRHAILHNYKHPEVTATQVMRII
jgi:hypothetical protein